MSEIPAIREPEDPHVTDAAPGSSDSTPLAVRTPRRDASGTLVAAARSRSMRGDATAATPRGSRTPATGSTNPTVVGELIAQLQRVEQRQRIRADERTFTRDIEKIITQLAQRARLDSAHETRPSHALSMTSSGSESSFLSSLAARYTQLHHGGDTSSESGTDSTVSTAGPPSSTTPRPWQRRSPDANVETLLDAMHALFSHRYQDVRTLAFEIVNLCIRNYGTKLTSATRRRIFQQLEDHDASGDSQQLQKTLRLLTLDGRNVEPFQAELGWLLVQWLEESDEQRDLLHLIQHILKRSPLMLEFEAVIAITSVVCGRCDVAMSRREMETCKRFLAFFHVLATHGLEHALGTSVCLRTLCWMVNLDQETWLVMKYLLNSSAGLQVLRGLVTLLENPLQHNEWILRGAVFYVGMSCWGSQRAARLGELKWAPILLAIETCLQSEHGLVVFEIILAIQRLIKKFGDSKPSAAPQEVGRSADTAKPSPSKGLVVEWDIILRMFRTLRPWLSRGEITASRVVVRQGSGGKVIKQNITAAAALTRSSSGSASQIPADIPVHMTRIPQELLDTLQVVVDLVRTGKFTGEIEEFYDVLDEYFAYLPEPAIRLLLRYKAEAAHPAHHIDWLHSLESTMGTFFVDRQVSASVREETLELLQVNLWSSRNVCEDRVVEEVLLPMLADVYDDPEPNIRRKALDLITEVARTLESVRFDSLLEILENAVQLSVFEDSQLCAISGIVSLFSSYFNHLPQSRALRMYDIITTVVESHRNWEVRHCALRCLLHVCEASSDFRLQWKDTKTRTSRFLFCSRRAVRNQQTGAFVRVHNGLRALLTLVSTESHANLFRMAVEGLRRMLHNRVILTDIDISDTAMKIISCIDYQAFGRAAIPDELQTFSVELEKESALQGAASSQVAESVDSGGSNGSRPARSHTATRINLLEIKSSFREAAALLCKIRFTTMGLQLLELFVSYISELNARARHHLMICVIGAIDTQLLISDHDFIPTVGEEHETSSTHSGSAWIWPSRPRANSSHRASFGTVSVEEAGSQPAAQVSGHGATSYADSKPISPKVPFTSRVLSKLSGAHQSGIFHALTSSAHGGASGDQRSTASDSSVLATARHEKQLLLRCLRLVFDAEFTLLHTATNAISLLGHIVPDVVSARLDLLLRSGTRCFFTPDGSFRSDGYAAVLEMMGNLVVSTPAVVMQLEHKCRMLEDLVLVAFRRHIDKATTYLAYRLLCEIIFQCQDKQHRISLATAALPLLKESATLAITNHTLTLAEAAIDFLMCFALSRTDLVLAPALRITDSETKRHGVDDKQAGVTQRSWVYHNTIVTIEVRPNRPSLLIVRRASSTSRWHLSMRQDYISDPFSLRSSKQAKPLIRKMSSLTGPESSNMRQKAQAPTNGDGLDTRDVAVRSDRRSLDRPPQVPGQVVQSRAADKPSDRRRARTSPARTSPPLSNRNDYATLPSRHLPVPPLPAYDGIGGSPSFFCETTPAESEPGATDAMEPMLLSDSAHTSSDPSQEKDESKRLVGDTTQAESIGEDGRDAMSGVVKKADPSAGESEGVAGPATTSPSDSASARSQSTGGDEAEDNTPASRELDPVFLMMQLFDLGVDDRPQLLVNGPSLALGLNVLDRTPEFETHKIGVLYLRSSKRKTEVELLGSFGGSLRYLQFLRALGTVTQLEGLRGYSGGMDTSASHTDGKCMLLYRSHSLQMVFHVATMMTAHDDLETEQLDTPSDGTTRSDRKYSSTTMKKKRHIGNDFVHIVFKECDEEYDVQTFSGQFNDVHIIVQPLNDLEYRTRVKCKPGIAPFGPLYGTQIIPSSLVAVCVRQTALNANLACHAFHQEQLGFTMNCEERLKQIKQLAARHTAPGDEWTLDSTGEQPSRRG